MKWPKIYLLIFVIFALCYPTACSQNGSAFTQSQCSYKGEVCIKINTVYRFTIGDPVTLTITLTGRKDVPDLQVELNTSTEVTVDGPETWESYSSAPHIERGFVYWHSSIKQGQTLTFSRVIHFPPKEGIFDVQAEAITLGRLIYAVDSFGVLLTKDGGFVLRYGTPYPPYTPNASLAVYGPGTPVPTFCCATNTPIPARVTTSTPTQLVPLVSTSTPLTSPYPAPSSYP